MIRILKLLSNSFGLVREELRECISLSQPFLTLYAQMTDTNVLFLFPVLLPDHVQRVHARVVVQLRLLKMHLYFVRVPLRIEFLDETHSRGKEQRAI